MKRISDNEVVSDSGHTLIVKGTDGTYHTMQHSIAATSLSMEDLRMTGNPERFWIENQVDELPIQS